MDLRSVTFETNGSQMLSVELGDYLAEKAYDEGLEIVWSISAKLPSSGEAWEDAIRPDAVNSYLSLTISKAYFKFVVATEQDIEDVERALDQYASEGIDIPVYLMPVGGINAVYDMNERKVADFCRDNGYRFSPRIQVPLYKNEWGT